jgi:hypothetical protein
MAFVDSSLDIVEKNYPYIYNVSFAVGYGRYNVRDDVLLVQYFLKKIWDKHRTKAQPPAGTMAVDGWMGPTTDRWIRNFQSGATMKIPDPSVMFQDGIVNRAVAAQSVAGSDKSYTIVMLNYNFQVKYPELYPMLPAAPDLPPELAYSLSTTSQA